MLLHNFVNEALFYVVNSPLECKVFIVKNRSFASSARVWMSLSAGISAAPCCLVVIYRIFFEIFMAVISTERTAMVSLFVYFMCIQPSM